MRYKIHLSFILSFIIFDKFMRNSLNFMIPNFFYFTLFSSIRYFIRDRKSSSPHHHLVKYLIQPSRQMLIPSHSPLSLFWEIHFVRTFSHKFQTGLKPKYKSHIQCDTFENKISALDF